MPQYESDASSFLGEEGEGEKAQWCTPETAERSFGNACYCQQLLCSFPFQRKTHTHTVLHDMCHMSVHSQNTTITVLVKVLKGKVNNMFPTTSFCATIAYLNSTSTILIFKKIKQES